MTRLKKFPVSIKESLNFDTDIKKLQKGLKGVAPYVYVGAAPKYKTDDDWIVIGMATPSEKEWERGYFENADVAVKIMLYENGKLKLLKITKAPDFKDIVTKDIKEVIKLLTDYGKELTNFVD